MEVPAEHRSVSIENEPMKVWALTEERDGESPELQLWTGMRKNRNPRSRTILTNLR